MSYYTGVIFEGFAPNIGYSIISGGRYDELIGHYGRAFPAVGFAIGVERVMLALSHKPALLAPHRVAQACIHPACYARIAEARYAGERVLVDVLGRRGEALREYARTLGVTRVLECLEEGK
jgi:ATP phosphoribosyltransferase regulatory subunit